MLIPILQTFMKEKPAAEWIEQLGKAGVPCGPINDMAQVFDSPQIRHRKLRIELDHAVAGPVPLVANPIRFSGEAREPALAPPVLGQHTDEILGDLLGMAAGDIARLREGGVV